MIVTATRTVSRSSADIRNGAQRRRPNGVTDKRPGDYGFRPIPVTCKLCGVDIPADKNMMVFHRTGVFPGVLSGDIICIPCVKERRKSNPLTADLWLPWGGWGARAAGRTREDYQHRCLRCGRPFYGAMARRYCTDECGELARRERRDRTRDRIARPCDACGDTFTPPRSDGRYCSSACRQKAYRRRKAGAA